MKWVSMLRFLAQIVQQLVVEVEAASEAMLAGLMAKLHGPIQLPECLRIVGCLRRLAPFPEAELRRRSPPRPLLYYSGCLVRSVDITHATVMPATQQPAGLTLIQSCLEIC